VAHDVGVDRLRLREQSLLLVERLLQRRRRHVERDRLVLLEDVLALEIPRLRRPPRRLLLLRLLQSLPLIERLHQLFVGELAAARGEERAAGAGLRLDDAPARRITPDEALERLRGARVVAGVGVDARDAERDVLDALLLRVAP